jgi:uncharacterized protein (TIGR02996 family)
MQHKRPPVTDTEQSLLNDVCATPGDDGPRLVYADFLDERGEGTDRERAEYIRGNIARSSCHAFMYSCFENGYDYCQCEALKWFLDGKGCVTVRSGFPAELRVSMAEFLGGECERCDRTGQAETWDGRVPVIRYEVCPACHGTGRTPGLAEVAAERWWPITRVVLADREPVLVDGDPAHDEFVGRWIWWQGDGRIEDNGPGVIPIELIPKDFLRDVWAFDTRDAALAALSDACCRMIRDRRAKKPIANAAGNYNYAAAALDLQIFARGTQ